MKTAIATILAAAFGFFSSAALAAETHDKHDSHNMNNAASPHAAMSEGVIRKVDMTSGKVTINHGPLANLGMPAMTMAFRVKDAAWLGKMKTDDKIRFVAESVDGALTVVHFEPVK